MDLRSEFILGKEIFIKIIRISRENFIDFKNALLDKNYIPFPCNEIAINYLLTTYEKELISPNTYIFYTNRSYNLYEYKDLAFTDILEKMKKYKEFSPEDFVQEDNVETFLILSQRVTGNLEQFINIRSIELEDRKKWEWEKELTDAFIHICYLYYKFQKVFTAVHIDPKLSNHTWLKLDKPIDITYDFDEKKIVRKNVRNLFFLTDLEFIYSPIIKSQDIGNNKFYYNFSRIYDWLKDNRENLIIVPKISSEYGNIYYDYNVNLFGGYNAPIKLSDNVEEKDIKRIFGLFPRMFAIDLLTLIKMILTYDYSEKLSSNIRRKFNMYFTLFQSLSRQEKENKYRVNYEKVSPISFADFLNT